MNSWEWRHVLAGAVRTMAALRTAASPQSVEAVERRWGVRLPESFRNFLLTHDGGRIGELLIFGTEELLQFDAIDSEYRHLIPFHPIEDSGEYECFDTHQFADDECPVIWLSPGDSETRLTYVDFTDWFFDQVLDLKDQAACS